MFSFKKLSFPKIDSPQKPFRAEVLANEQLAARAVELAEFYSHQKQKIRGAKLQRRFKENTKALSAAYFSFAEAARQKEALTAGAEWLLDNYHVIDEQAREIRRDLPRGYYRALPKLADSEWRGLPRVYRLVCDFIAHTDAVVDTESLSVFVAAYQSKRTLFMGEIWAVPIMLRLALVENLRRLADASMKLAQQRRMAEEICKETIDATGKEGHDLLLEIVTKLQENPEVLEHGAAHIIRRLRAKGGASSLTLMWLDQQLREKGLDPNDLIRLEQQSQAADQISFGNCVTSLKTLGNLDWREWFESVSEVDKILSKDPTGVYLVSDFYTRDRYRHQIEKLARLSKLSELTVAQQVIDLAEETKVQSVESGSVDRRFYHVGYFLIDDGFKKLVSSLNLNKAPGVRIKSWAKDHAFFLYFSAICLVSLLGLTSIGFYSFKAGASPWLTVVLLALFLVPWTEFAIQIVQWIVSRFSSPQPLPKLDFENGVNEEARTLIVVQTIVNDRESLERTVHQLEIRAIGNFDSQLYYGVLADLGDAQTEVLAGDAGIMSRGRELIEDLNQRYCSDKEPRFFMLFRRRQFNPQENTFMAWERKRGKIMEFNRLLLGDNHTSFNVIIGDLPGLRKARYVITLDNDTQLPPNSAHRLVGAIAHPLNRPLLDPETRLVIKGYGIIQPRVGITLQSSHATYFANLFSGHSGLDPYTHTVSDVYQDLFAEGSYIGKGIYDVEALEASLENRFPENALLSHDLIEGTFARCGLASDVEVYDDFPARYHAQARRQHRWIRGDWQIMPWLGRRVPDGQQNLGSNPLSYLSLWKIFDNLRRSVFPITMFVALLMMLTVAPGSQCFWVGVVFVILGFQTYVHVWRLFFDIPFGYSLRTHFYSVLNDIKRNLFLMFFNIILLPHQAWFSLNAIMITLYRLYFTKRQMLEWETASAAERRLGGTLKDFMTFMCPVWPLLLVSGVIVILSVNSLAIPLASLLFFCWFVSPVIAYQMSKPIPEKGGPLHNDERNYLLKVAYATWRYFDTFLRAEYNFLIPDNLQLVPREVVAERTSPTNISLSALSVTSAYDLGFIPLSTVVDKISEIFSTLKRLERFKGHFLNWYAIRDLRPLAPRYVSTVDSGNLIGHFIAIRQMLLNAFRMPLLTERHFSALKTLTNQPSGAITDLISQLQFVQVTANLKSLISSLQILKQLRVELQRLQQSNDLTDLSYLLESLLTIEELFTWTEHLDLIKTFGQRGLLPKKLKEIDRILEGRMPTLSLLGKLCRRMIKIEDALEFQKLSATEKKRFLEFISALRHAEERIVKLELARTSIITDIERFIEEADFKFLSDPARKLLTIGFNVDTGLRDNSFYDLLASEARLTSLIAIAKGDLPQAHWFRLNRTLTQTQGGKALLSWAGTMFEYLMPLLVTRDFPSTLLGQTFRAIVRAQRFYAAVHGIPWGISESGYSGVDFERTYQYQAFGIPGLGLKRGLADNLVISPYSTVLALMVDAHSAVANLRRLENEGVFGRYGFYEAVDYTPSRLGAEEKSHIVRSFLAHHQGMSLVAINNVLSNNVFQERFHSNPAIRSCEILLQERFPTKIPVLIPHQAELERIGVAEEDERPDASERLESPHTQFPRTRILSNGRYTVVLDNSGAGYSYVDGNLALTRFREDGISNNWGTFCYLRDLDSRNFWSAAYQPTCVEPDSYQVVFGPDKIEYLRRDHGVVCKSQIVVSPEDNVEVRRYIVTNVSGRVRNIELTSYGEVCLAQNRADLAHPAFSKMFIEAEFIEDFNAILFTRKPRNRNEPHLYMMHLIQSCDTFGEVQFDTMRQRFLGRGGNVKHPKGMLSSEPLSRSSGTVLDPVFALRSRMSIPSGEGSSVCFATAFSADRDEILEVMRRYSEGRHLARAFEMSWSHSDIELRHQQFSISRVHDYQHLANAIIYNVLRLRPSADILKRNTLAQQALWRFGISGDEPIVLFIISDPDQLKTAEELLLAHEYLRLHGFSFELVILNDYPGGYLQDLQHELEGLINAGYSRHLAEKRQGVFLRSAHHLTEEERILLQTVARVVIYGSNGTLATQLEALTKVDSQAPRPHRREPRRTQQVRFKPEEEMVEYANSVGGFADNGSSYLLDVSYDRLPPRPWSNVIANKDFGFLVTEGGGGFTWAGNSREMRLTPWTNDPVIDLPGEVIYIRDAQTGEYWAPTPLPVRFEQPVRVKHRKGSSEFLTEVSKLSSHLVVHGSDSERVKFWQLELGNNGLEERTVEVFLYLDPVLGVSRDETYRFLQSNFDEESQILYLQNSYNPYFSKQVTFIGSNLSLHSFTSSRGEFIGRHHDVARPDVLEPVPVPAGLGTLFAGSKLMPVTLSRTVGTGFEQCAALKVQATISPGERYHVLFYLAQADTIQEARRSSARYRSLGYSQKALAKVKTFWNDLCTSVKVATPERSFDILVNGWLLYQSLSCRIFARTGFYQSSGAFGFRDQLQDSLALVYALPEATREQILLHASRQFVEGDVQHWWHPPRGQGIRTKISDNYLWLPFVTEQYLTITGDLSILDESVPFLEGPVIEEGEDESYHLPKVSQEAKSLYQHCILALDRALVLGSHGLPLIGTGDWNDGFNLVGAEGKGESVWLGWFICDLLRKFSAICAARGDADREDGYKRAASLIHQSIEEQAWDGYWYRRAYFDDGTPLGSANNSEAQIDSLAQSWSVISGFGLPERQQQAMKSVYRHLLREDQGLLCLLWPPFERSLPSPGYIQAYPAGIRENGGQYTHAAAWVVLAAAMAGDGNSAFKIFQTINPIRHTATSDGVKRYKAEPYVTCGDVYSRAPRVGTGGWSWYTGSSAWLYKTAVEYIIGLKLRGDTLVIDPCIPSAWDSFKVEYTFKGVKYHIMVKNPKRLEKGVDRVLVDGVVVESKQIPVSNYQAGEEHHIEVVMG